MNGRVYSAELGKMMSPDPVTQAPSMGRNYNRYAYVFNNPLRNIDPSGYLTCPKGGNGSLNCPDVTKPNGSGGGLTGGAVGSGGPTHYDPPAAPSDISEGFDFGDVVGADEAGSSDIDSPDSESGSDGSEGGEYKQPNGTTELPEVGVIADPHQPSGGSLFDGYINSINGRRDMMGAFAGWLGDSDYRFSMHYSRGVGFGFDVVTAMDDLMEGKFDIEPSFILLGLGKDIGGGMDFLIYESGKLSTPISFDVSGCVSSVGCGSVEFLGDSLIKVTGTGGGRAGASVQVSIRYKGKADF